MYYFQYINVFPAVKISPVKQSQLRNFLSKGQMPPVRSTAPGTHTRLKLRVSRVYKDMFLCSFGLLSINL